VTLDLQEAVKSVKIAENIQNDLWEEFFAGPFEGEPESPKEFSDGVLVGDPVEGIVTSVLDPQPLLSFLVTVGYAAANVPVIGEASCDREQVLNNIASRLSEDIAAGDETIASFPTDLCLLATTTGPLPVRPPRPATAPPWSTIPRDGPLPGIWTPGGWPVTPPYNCRTVTVSGGAANNCICSRAQIHGRWETRNGRITWRLVTERETCTDPARTTPCPGPTGPPDAQMSCSSTFS
jgi:hypothetical protein